jgi:hypothetical protein
MLCVQEFTIYLTVLKSRAIYRISRITQPNLNLSIVFNTIGQIVMSTCE